jgi:FkbM family methyltransferase
MKSVNCSKYIIFALSLLIGIVAIYNYKLNKKIHALRARQTEVVLAPVNNCEVDTQQPLDKFAGILVNDKNGFDLLLMGNDLVSKDIFRNKQWEPHLQNALTQLVKSGDKALILGAHIGCHSLLISKLVGAEGKVSIFEPNPHTLKFLRANLALNNIHNTILFPKAAFSKNTTLQFVATINGNTGASHVQREGDDDNHPELITVPAVSIDSIKEIKTIDILQMDVEGIEPEAVYGATRLIDNSPNLIVFQEWSPFWMKDVDSYLNFWRSRGYSIAQITTTGLKELTDEQLKAVTIVSQIDIILTKKLDQAISNFKPL